MAFGRKKEKLPDANPKKMKAYIKELVAIKREMLGDEDADREETELANMDKFQKKKHQLNKLLKELRTSTTTLNAKRKEAGGERNQDVIRLMNNNGKAIQQATAMWQEAGQILKEDAKKRGKKLGEEQLADRQKALNLLGQELKDLAGKNSRVKGASTMGGGLGDGGDDFASAGGLQNKRQQRAQRQKKRKDRRVGRMKGNHIELDDFNIEDATPMGQEEQQWMQQVEQNNAEQDELLDVISQGLDDLQELAIDMNKELDTQKVLLEETDIQMDKTKDKFQQANVQLKDILDRSGGMTRWCPFMVCMIFLLALVGYMVNIFG